MIVAITAGITPWNAAAVSTPKGKYCMASAVMKNVASTATVVVSPRNLFLCKNNVEAL